jgi:Fe-Mn family superoxide dismutase
LAFHASGVEMHNLYWENMTPNKTEISPELSQKIISSFGSLESFEKEFKSTSAVVEGSGWSALVEKD